jgi:hypothetical protein
MVRSAGEILRARRWSLLPGPHGLRPSPPDPGLRSGSPCGLLAGCGPAAARACRASSKVRASGIRRSSLVSRNSCRIFGRTQTRRRLPPYPSARLAAPASAPSLAESMKLARSRSALSGWPTAASSKPLAQPGHSGDVDLPDNGHDRATPFVATPMVSASPMASLPPGPPPPGPAGP